MLYIIRYAISIIPVMEDKNHLNYVKDVPTIHEINCTNRVCNQVLKVHIILIQLKAINIFKFNFTKCTLLNFLFIFRN